VPRVAETKPLKLHLGCGLNVVEGWVNIDGSWNARLAKYPRLRRALAVARVVPPESAKVEWRGDLRILDVRDPLPFSTSSCDAIYASHLLEHLFLDDALKLLRECFRLLRPGGTFRLVVPDLRAIVREYNGERVFHNSDEFAAMPAADRMNRRLLFRSPGAPRGNVLMRVYAALKDFQTHKWMYDAESLVAHMRSVGFGDVAERGFRESRIDDIDRLEHPGRVLQGEGICVEGLKPGARTLAEGSAHELETVGNVRD
jgi:predicted SAM-dependent methyltransferase